MKNKLTEYIRKEHSSKIALQGGSYSLVITAVFLAILIAVNICVSALPTTLTKMDISSSQLYSITSNTKVVVNSLEKDVTIYWIVQADQEDEIIENLLSKYESLSSHIRVIKKNPDIFPKFAEQYTNDAVQNNSLVVECGERSRYIAYSDIYLQDLDMYSYTYTTSFDGEGAITSAIDFVVSDDLPVIYILQGHGEIDIPDSFLKQLEKENMNLQPLSLLMVDAIPDDADGIFIYGPQSDISEEEKDMLLDYVCADGKLLVMAGPVEDGTLENLNAILSNYGVETQSGIVVESDRNYYAFQQPYILIPDMNSSEITDSLRNTRYLAIMPISSGLMPDYSSTVTELLTTSSYAYSKVAGFSLDTYEKEENDVDGPFALAVAIDSGVTGKIVWFASADFLDDMYNAYSSGANNDLAMNAMSYLIGESEAIAIRSKSLNYNYLTISESEATSLKTIMIGILPAVYLLFGICVVVETRKKQYETE